VTIHQKDYQHFFEEAMSKVTTFTFDSKHGWYTKTEPSPKPDPVRRNVDERMRRWKKEGKR